MLSAACKPGGEDAAPAGVFGPGPTVLGTSRTEVGRRFEALTTAVGGFHQRSAELVKIASGGLTTVALGAGKATVKLHVDDDAAAMSSPLARCAVGDYTEAFRLYKTAGNRSDGDTYIVTATCAFAFHDYAGAERLALQGARVSGGGGRAHNYFIAELAAQRRGGSGEGHGQAGIAAAKQSGQCSGAKDPMICAELYRVSVQNGVERFQETLGRP